MTEISVTRTSVIRKGHPKVPSRNTLVLLAERNDYSTFRIDTFGVRIDPIIVTKRDVNKTTLIRTHRRKVYRATLCHSTSGSALRHPDHLIMAAALIALNINGDRIAETELTAYKQGNQSLKGLERATMTTDQDGEIRSSDVKDQLTLITLVLINRRVIGIEVDEDRTHDRDGHICNRIQFLISQLKTGLVVSSDFWIITSDLITRRRWGLVFQLCNTLVSHDVLHC